LNTDDCFDFVEPQLLENQRLYEVAARSIAILIGK
jgi:hypothetical protein